MSQFDQDTLGANRANRRSFSLNMTLAFLVGVPIGFGLLALVHRGPLHDTILLRYTSHPIEMVAVILFGCAMGALLTRLMSWLKDAAAIRADWLPAWNGKPIPVEAAAVLLEDARQISRTLQNSRVGRRITNILDFVHNRRSANELDDHLRGLADNDDVALENNYGLIRFITWAIPILGFLGTVLGITGAISGVTPDKLENNISQVTDGLATAFDTTAVALALTMVVMFISFLMERLEQNQLERINEFAEGQLAHRFERSGPDSQAFVFALRKNSEVLLQATEELIQKQAKIWQSSLYEAQKQWLETGREQQQKVVEGLEHVIQRTANSHAKRLAQQEKQNNESAAGTLTKLDELTVALSATAAGQQQDIANLMQRVTQQTEALAQLTGNGSQLTQLQEALHHNLNTLAGAGAFEEAVNSLTAAIHLLTSRTAGSAFNPQKDAPARPGNAA